MDLDDKYFYSSSVLFILFAISSESETKNIPLLQLHFLLKMTSVTLI